MTALRFSPPRLETWVDHNEVVHLCFEWYSDFAHRTYWSTVCLEYDALKVFIDNDGTDHATCVRCIGGAATP